MRLVRYLTSYSLVARSVCAKQRCVHHQSRSMFNNPGWVSHSTYIVFTSKYILQLSILSRGHYGPPVLIISTNGTSRPFSVRYRSYFVGSITNARAQFPIMAGGVPSLLACLSACHTLPFLAFSTTMDPDFCVQPLSRSGQIRAKSRVRSTDATTMFLSASSSSPPPRSRGPYLSFFHFFLLHISALVKS